MKFLEAFEKAEEMQRIIHIQTPEMMDMTEKRMLWIRLNPFEYDFSEVDPKWERSYFLDIHDLRRDDWRITEYKYRG